MALHHPLSLRRALSLSVSLLHRSLHGPKPISSHLLPTPRPTPTPTPIPTPTVSFTQLARPFTSTTALFRKAFDPETDEIGPDTILFEGCDYKHWLITMDFRDSNLTRDQMIDTYVNTAAQVFGSIEEAKKKIYALSTTTYQGFQVECSEETSEKFKGIPGVVFVLPDSYIDPANKEYGGDKYINGEIIPRPPPVHYARHNRNRPRPSEQNYGPPRQQNYGPGPQQNYGPGPQQNYRPAPQQNYGPAPQQNYRPAPQQNYRPAPAQNYGPPPAQNYGPPPSQNNGPTPQQNYGPTPVPNYGQLPQNQGPPPQQNYAPPPQQNYRPVQQQGYTPQPHQSYESPPQQGYVPRMQRGNYLNSPNNASGRDERNYAHGQGDLQSHVPTEQRGFSEDGSYGSSQGGSFEQSGERRNF